MEAKMPDLNYCSHKHSSEEQGAAPRWGCIQEVVPKRISREQKGHHFRHQNLFYSGFVCTAIHKKF